MKKLLSILTITALLTAQLAAAKGKIQDEDVKSEAELISAGSNKTHLPNAQKVYVTANGINDTLHNAITNGAIGGGGSGTGINILKDPGFEAAGTSPEWTNTGGTFTHVTSGPNLLVGIGSATFQASATSQSVQGTLHTIPNGLLGQACAASLMYKGGDANLTFEVVDGSSAVVASKVLSASPGPQVVNLPFLCPGSGSLRWKVISTASSASIALDQAFLGQNSLIQVSQSGVFGYVQYDLGCAWGMSANSSFQQMTDGGACTSVVHGGLSNPAPTNLGFTLNNAPPGDYDISVRGTIYASSAGHTNTACAFNAYDTTLAVAAPAVLVGTIPTASGNPEAIVPMMSFHLNYSQAGSHVIEIHGASHDGYESCNVAAADGSVGVEILVTYHPSAAQIATQATTQAATFQGSIDGAAWSTTSTTRVDGSVSGTPVLTQTLNTNFGAVDIDGTNAGIIINMQAGHTYDVMFGSNAAGNTTGQAYQLFLGDGVNADAAHVQGYYASPGDPLPVVLRGQFKPAATGPVHLKVQMLYSTSGGTMQYAGGNSHIDVSVQDITQPGPQLAMPGNVSSPSAGQEMIGRMYVSSCTSDPCLVQTQTPGLVSAVNRLGSGHYAIHFAPGTFSNAGGDFPVCTFTSTSTVGPIVIDQLDPLQVTFYNMSPAPNDTGFNAICMGSK